MLTSCIEVQMLGSGRDLKTKSSIQETKLYVSLTHQVLQAIEDSLCLKTFSICLCYVYKYLLCLRVPSYAQNFIYTILNHTCTSVMGFVYVRHKVY